MHRHRGRTLALIALLAAALVALVAHHLWTAPDVVLLVPADGADWVRPDTEFHLASHQNPTTFAVFETTLTTPPGFAGATLSVTALKRVAVDVDGTRLFDSGDRDATWKQTCTVALPAHLSAGRHRLRFTVGNHYGPALVRVACGPLGLASGHGDWRASGDGVDWKPPVVASVPWRSILSDRWERTAPFLWRRLPLLAGLFAIGAGASLWSTSPTADRRPVDRGRVVRWAVVSLWVILAAVDLRWTSPADGYDADSHFAYIRHVAEHLRLPMPDAGPEFFQAPLYYVVSAGLWRALLVVGVKAAAMPTWMRLVPIACAVGLAELCYRAARHAFPGRSDLHAIAVVVGGLIPMNLYMGPFVSNEPAAGLVGGAVAVVGVRLLARPAEGVDRRWHAAAGLLLGLAFVTKVSMAVWAGPLAAAVAVAAARRGGAAAARAVVTVAVVAAAVSAPYVLRTWSVAGTPVISHAVLHDGGWWQDPGYRTPRQFLTFDRGLTRVAYGGTDGLWDALYTTTWGDGFLGGEIDPDHHTKLRFDLMSCGLWLGLVPMAAMGFGALAGRVRGGRWFPTVSVAAFLLAVAGVYLTLPIYSCGKGSYLLSTLPCATVLAAAGFDRVMVGRRSRAVVAGLLTCWAVTSWATYIVTR
jgi:hypothetical protein